MGYIHKPPSREVDALRTVVDRLRDRGNEVGISKLYEALAKRAVNAYFYDTDAFLEDMRAYLKRTHLPRSPTDQDPGGGAMVA